MVELLGRLQKEKDQADKGLKDPVSMGKKGERKVLWSKKGPLVFVPERWKGNNIAYALCVG